MNILEFACSINQTLEIEWSVHYDGKFCAHFKKCWVVDDIALSPVVGIGKNPQSAISAYARKISGKRIRFYFAGTRFIEITAPALEEVAF